MEDMSLYDIPDNCHLVQVVVTDPEQRKRRTSYEERMAQCLNSIGLKFTEQYRVPDSAYAYDFCVPSIGTLIECDGRQHFEFIKHFHRTEEGFNAQKYRDNAKNVLAEENGYRLIRVDYTQKNKFMEHLERAISSSGQLYTSSYLYDGLWTNPILLERNNKHLVMEVSEWISSLPQETDECIPVRREILSEFIKSILPYSYDLGVPYLVSETSPYGTGVIELRSSRMPIHCCYPRFREGEWIPSSSCNYGTVIIVFDESLMIWHPCGELEAKKRIKNISMVFFNKVQASVKLINSREDCHHLIPDLLNALAAKKAQLFSSQGMFSYPSTTEWSNPKRYVKSPIYVKESGMILPSFGSFHERLPLSDLDTREDMVPIANGMMLDFEECKIRKRTHLDIWSHFLPHIECSPDLSSLVKAITDKVTRNYFYNYIAVWIRGIEVYNQIPIFHLPDNENVEWMSRLLEEIGGNMFYITSKHIFSTDKGKEFGSGNGLHRKLEMECSFKRRLTCQTVTEEGHSLIRFPIRRHIKHTTWPGSKEPRSSAAIVTSFDIQIKCHKAMCTKLAVIRMPSLKDVPIDRELTWGLLTRSMNKTGEQLRTEIHHNKPDGCHVRETSDSILARWLS